jgi:hypothetical protein
VKSKKHTKLLSDFESQKQIHLERLATKMLEKDEKLQKLKGKNIDPGFLKLF